jgi:hypothetical protein
VSARRTASASNSFANRRRRVIKFLIPHWQLSTFPKKVQLAFLGIDSSPAFVRSPEGNGCAERFIRTLKENLLWVQTFKTIEAPRQALLAFRETYNTTWRIGSSASKRVARAAA